MTDLSDAERAILNLLAASDGPVDMQTGIDALMPPCPSRLHRRGRRAWLRQWSATLGVWLTLAKTGMVTPAWPGPCGFEISDAGRDALNGCLKQICPGCDGRGPNCHRCDEDFRDAATASP